MQLRDDQTINIQKLVSALYSQPLTNESLMNLSPLICTITDSHYFALILFPGENVPEPLYTSNNPDDFNTIYNEVQGMDFMLHRLTENAKPVHFTQLIREPIPNKEDFLVDLDRSRPVSDCLYIPVLLKGRISGLIGIAREGKSNSPFSSNEVAIIRFTAAFIAESISKNLRMPHAEKGEAVLDRKGEVLDIDDRAKETFQLLFGECWKTPLLGKSKYSKDFSQAWNRFNSPIYCPGDSILELNDMEKNFWFEFDYSHNKFLEPVLTEAPYIKISVNESGAPCIIHNNDRYNLSSREQDIVNCIYRGQSNKEISEQMHISVSTVKKHIWNIYNKVGVDNRTSLIFVLSK